MERRFFGLTRSDVMRMAYRLAQVYKKDNKFNITSERAGWKWLRYFLRRHPELSPRTPQPLSAARMKGFTKENVDRFFDVYEVEMAKIKFNPTRLFNVDETGVTIVQHKTSQIIGKKGKRQIATLSSAERGHLITVVTCMSASGQHMPPKIIWPRKNMKMELMNGTPPGCTYSCHESGWIQSDSFTEWFMEFIKLTRPTEEDPVVLVLDGHYSHTRNLEVILAARKNFVTIVCLPPHCTHRMQPLDKSFMSPFKTYYAQSIEQWLKHNPGRKVTIYQIGEIFGQAFLKAASYQTAVNGFCATGLFPVNRNYFTDADFLIDSKDFEKTPEALKPVTIGSPNEIIVACAVTQESRESSESPAPQTEANSELTSHLQSTSSTTRQSIINIASALIGPLPTASKVQETPRKKTPSPILISGSPHKKALEQFQAEKKDKLAKAATSKFSSFLPPVVNFTKFTLSLFSERELYAKKKQCAAKKDDPSFNPDNSLSDKPGPSRGTVVYLECFFLNFNFLPHLDCLLLSRSRSSKRFNLYRNEKTCISQTLNARQWKDSSGNERRCDLSVLLHTFFA